MGRAPDTGSPPLHRSLVDELWKGGEGAGLVRPKEGPSLAWGWGSVP